jgi:outer membrane protein assembly factor BamA
MNKLFAILTVVAISTTMIFSQQGTVAIGVGSNLANQSWQDYSLVPTVGYFISDNMMVGTGFTMGSSIDEVGTTEYKSSAMSVSPFARFYLNESMYISAGIDMTSFNSITEDDTNKDTYTESTFGFNGGVGYSLMWNDHICIEPSFGFGTSGGSTTSEFESGGNTNSNSTDAPTTFGMAIGLGINIRLGVE